MEQQEPIETVYGTSLDLDIPALKCKRGAELEEDEVDCLQTAEYPDNNKYHVNIINAFIDFFVQYYNHTIDDTSGDDGNKFGKYLQNVLQLKKIMYSFTIEHKDKYRSTIDFLTKEKIEKNYADKIKRNFDMVSNMGRSNMELHVQPIGKFQKIVNLYLLVLSYSVLSFGGILGFDIIDIVDIIKEEKKRELDGKQSFILQFLPRNAEVSCFQTIQFFFTGNDTNQIIIQKMNRVASEEAGAGGGGSKHFQKKYNKSRKNKYKRKNKYNKSRKNKYSLYKIKIQSNKNKMF